MQVLVSYCPHLDKGWEEEKWFLETGTALTPSSQTTSDYKELADTGKEPEPMGG